MKLYLCTFRVDHAYMGLTERGEMDWRLVWANNEDEAHQKLASNLGIDRQGDDSHSLHIFEAHEAIA